MGRPMASRFAHFRPEFRPKPKKEKCRHEAKRGEQTTKYSNSLFMGIHLEWLLRWRKKKSWERRDEIENTIWIVRQPKMFQNPEKQNNATQMQNRFLAISFEIQQKKTKKTAEKQRKNDARCICGNEMAEYIPQVSCIKCNLLAFGVCLSSLCCLLLLLMAKTIEHRGSRSEMGECAVWQKKATSCWLRKTSRVLFQKKSVQKRSILKKNAFSFAMRFFFLLLPWTSIGRHLVRHFAKQWFRDKRAKAKNATVPLFGDFQWRRSVTVFNEQHTCSQHTTAIYDKCPNCRFQAQWAHQYE